MPQTFQDYGLQVGATPNFETLRYESPISLCGSIRFSGECFVGAFSYLQPRGEFTNTSIGRFCSISGSVCTGPGQHNPFALTTHPFICDPTDSSAGLSRFEAYRQIMGHRPITVPEEIGRRQSAPQVRIGHDVWIGMRAIIMGGVTIGDGAIIAAGAIVTKDVEPYAIVAGVPARVLRMRFAPAIVDQLRELRWWDYDMSQVSNQVDFGQVEDVIAFMQDRIKAGSLRRFSPTTYLAKRTGSNFNITPVPQENSAPAANELQTEAALA